jgi:hypothetical protein
MIKKKFTMPNHSDQNKPPQKTFIHCVLKMALEEINTLSDTLGTIQPSKYEVEKDTIECLAFLIYRKIHDIRGLMEEMLKENRFFGLD